MRGQSLRRSNRFDPEDLDDSPPLPDDDYCLSDQVQQHCSALEMFRVGVVSAQRILTHGVEDGPSHILEYLNALEEDSSELVLSPVHTSDWAALRVPVRLSCTAFSHPHARSIS